jgi:hypothetical protein
MKMNDLTSTTISYEKGGVTHVVSLEHPPIDPRRKQAIDYFRENGCSFFLDPARAVLENHVECGAQALRCNAAKRGWHRTLFSRSTLGFRHIYEHWILNYKKQLVTGTSSC